MSRRIPTLTSQLNVYVDGGQKLLGLATVTYPNFEAITETITGAGIMGEMVIISSGQFSAMELVMSFRHLLDDPMNYAVGKAYTFDCRTAIGYEDPTSYDIGQANERFSVRGPVKGINPGTRAPNAAADATISVACRRIEWFVDGAEKLLWDQHNVIYRHNGVDMYAPVRSIVG